jgi:SAM-dependent methyltransferase
MPKMQDDMATFWNDYYLESAGDTTIKDRQFFRIELEALTRAFGEVVSKMSPKSGMRVLELGSGTGILAETLLSRLPESLRRSIQYVGVDFSSDATKKAMSRNLAGAEFVASDFFEYFKQNKQGFDLVIAQRSIMAILDHEMQRNLLIAVRESLLPTGVGILSEATRQGFDALNGLRNRLGVKPIEKIWHCLYLDENEIKQVFGNVDIIDYSSMYWLITRVIYPYFEEPKHNTVIHELAASLPQGEGFGLVKLIRVKK